MMAPSPQSGGAVIAKACPDQLSSRYGLGRAKRPRFVIDIFYRIDKVIDQSWVCTSGTNIIILPLLSKVEISTLFRTAYINRTL